MAIEKVILFLVIMTTIRGDRVKLSCEQIRQFVDGHNLRRQQAAFGFVPRQPAAAKMHYVVWDEELAEKAGKWSENCLFGHNPDRTVFSQRWGIVGENVFYSSMYSPFGPVIPNIEEALNTWFAEWKDYKFEPYTLEIGSRIGHYTQMIWANTTKVGCGITQQRDDIGFVTSFFVCNYGPTGNWLGETPYDTQVSQGYLQCPTQDGCKKAYGKYCSFNIL